MRTRTRRYRSLAGEYKGKVKPPDAITEYEWSTVEADLAVGMNGRKPMIAEMGRGNRLISREDRACAPRAYTQDGARDGITQK